MAAPKEDNTDLVLSYLYLRRIVGILGFAFPIVLAVGAILYDINKCQALQDSISDYHNTNMRDAFVGLLSAISLFLFVYSGYDKLDSFMAKAAGILGFLVCIFPDDVDPVHNCAIKFDSLEDIPVWYDKVHFISAILFFLTLAYFSIVLFTKTKKDNDFLKPEEKTVAWLAWNSIKLFFQNQKSAKKTEAKKANPKKEKRNNLYRWCGYIIIICLAILGILFWQDMDKKRIFGIFPVVYTFETIALWAFAISWFVKGETILKD